MLLTDYIFSMTHSLKLQMILILILTGTVLPCRMLGVIAHPGQSLNGVGEDGNLHPYLLSELEELRLQGGSGDWPYSNQDGWGMSSHATVNGSATVQSVRSEIEAFQDTSYYTQANLLLAPDTVSILLGHLRQSSSGANGIANPHPFIFETDDGQIFSFGHNGDLNKEDLRELIGDEWLGQHPPQTYGSGDWQGLGWSDVVDSELFFFWIMKNIESSGSTEQGIVDALEILEIQQPYNIKNFILSDGNDLYAYRRSSATDIYYYDGGDGSSNHRAVMSTPPPTGASASLPWIALADRRLLIFRHDGSSEIRIIWSTSQIDDRYSPQQFSLDRAYPNPFNGSTIIPVSMHQSGTYNLSILNTLGQLIYSERYDARSMGQYDFSWHGQDNLGQTVNSGAYFYMVSAGSSAPISGKLLYLK